MNLLALGAALGFGIFACIIGTTKIRGSLGGFEVYRRWISTPFGAIIFLIVLSGAVYFGGVGLGIIAH